MALENATIDLARTRERPQLEKARSALQDSFGIWRNRTDLPADSAAMVRAMRDAWQTREDRLGLG